MRSFSSGDCFLVSEVTSFADVTDSSSFTTAPVFQSSLLISPVPVFSSGSTVMSSVAGPLLVNASITSLIAEPGVKTAPNSTSPVKIRRGWQFGDPLVTTLELELCSRFKIQSRSDGKKKTVLFLLRPVNYEGPPSLRLDPKTIRQPT